MVVVRRGGGIGGPVLEGHISGGYRKGQLGLPDDIGGECLFPVAGGGV